MANKKLNISYFTKTVTTKLNRALIYDEDNSSMMSHDLLTMSRRPFLKTSSGRLPGDVLKTSSRRLNFGLKDVLDWSEMEVATFFKDVVRTSSRRRAQDVF